MDPNLFRYIWRHTRASQIYIVMIVIASTLPYYASLDIPKTIVNGPIQGKSFKTPDATVPFLEISISLPEFLGGGTWVLSEGFQLDRMSYLVALSLLFLAFVCINGYLKYYINTYKGRLGERMLRRLRYELADRVLRFPHSQFKRMKASEVASMVKDEVEPLGGFIGQAFAEPMFLVCQAGTALLFIMLQSFWLGLIAAAVVGVQGLIIPRLRRRLLILGRERQLTARALAGRIGEIVEGVTEIRVNDASNFERADLVQRLARIFFIRFDFFKRKFMVKFLNNFLAQTTPFVFYLLGGYFAIVGSLDIGQLVAVIAAYKELPSPIKELIDWDQERLDVHIKYTQVVEQFSPERMIAEELQAPTPEPLAPLAGELAVSNVTLTDETGARLVDNVGFTMKIDEKVAAVGPVSSGAGTVAEMLVRLHTPDNGRIAIGERNLAELPESVLGRRVSFLAADPQFLQGSLRDAITYGLKHVPCVREGERTRLKLLEGRALFEAKASGNPELDIDGDWIDYAGAGCADAGALTRRIIELLEFAELDTGLFDLGLRDRIDPDRHGDTAEKMLLARRAMRPLLESGPLARLVDPLDPQRYNHQSTVAENLFFGTPVGAAFADQAVASNAHVLAILRQAGLDNALLAMGRTIAAQVTELFEDLPPDHPFFDRLSLMTAEEIPGYLAALGRTEDVGAERITAEDRATFLKLALAYIEPRHRLGLLTDELREQLLAARKLFREQLPEELRASIAFYDPEVYDAASTLRDNILFGRLAYGIADAGKRVGEAIRKVLDDLGLREAVYEVGLGFDIGVGGKRLTAEQRQKIALVRALLKRPDLLIANRALSALDGSAQSRLIEGVLAASRGAQGARPFGLFWVLADAALGKGFDRVLCFDAGRLVEDGAPQTLLDKNGKYARLVA